MAMECAMEELLDSPVSVTSPTLETIAPAVRTYPNN